MSYFLYYHVLESDGAEGYRLVHLPDCVSRDEGGIMWFEFTLPDAAKGLDLREIRVILSSDYHRYDVHSEELSGKILARQSEALTHLESYEVRDLIDAEVARV